MWLEQYLATYNRILVIVSHSQDFMNGVCTNIIHMQKKKITTYGGNYDTYVNSRAQLAGEPDEEVQLGARAGALCSCQRCDLPALPACHARTSLLLRIAMHPGPPCRQSEGCSASERGIQAHLCCVVQIKHMKEYIARFGHGSAKLARQAQSKEKTLEKMVSEGLTEKVDTESVVRIRFANVGKLPPPVLQFAGVQFGYSPSKVLYSDVDLGIDLDSRVAIVGGPTVRANLHCSSS